MLIFILIIMIIFIIFITTKKHRSRSKVLLSSCVLFSAAHKPFLTGIKPHEMHESVYATIPERKAEDVLMQDNEAYVSTQRVKRKIVSSEATVECYENPAYATTGK